MNRLCYVYAAIDGEFHVHTCPTFDEGVAEANAYLSRCGAAVPKVTQEKQGGVLATYLLSPGNHLTVWEVDDNAARDESHPRHYINHWSQDPLPVITHAPEDWPVCAAAAMPIYDYYTNDIGSHYSAQGATEADARIDALRQESSMHKFFPRVKPDPYLVKDVKAVLVRP